MLWLCPPTSPYPFLLTQNLSSKRIAPTDIMWPKLHDQYTQYLWLKGGFIIAFIVVPCREAIFLPKQLLWLTGGYVWTQTGLSCMHSPYLRHLRQNFCYLLCSACLMCLHSRYSHSSCLSWCRCQHNCFLVQYVCMLRLSFLAVFHKHHVLISPWS